MGGSLVQKELVDVSCRKHELWLGKGGHSVSSSAFSDVQQMSCFSLVPVSLLRSGARIIHIFSRAVLYAVKLQCGQHFRRHI